MHFGAPGATHVRRRGGGLGRRRRAGDRFHVDADRIVGGGARFADARGREGAKAEAVSNGGCLPQDFTRPHHANDRLVFDAPGSLLAGVSHELDNPLTVVVARAVLLEEHGEPATQAAAVKIRTAAERCARIVRTFLAMARQQRPERGPVDIREVVDAALDIAACALRASGVEVAVGCLPELPRVFADADPLHQVMFNLMINAQQALQDRPPPRRIRVAGRFDPGRRVLTLTVSDDGPGIPAALRARVFEPFSTTKPTGVGLAVSLGVVEAHGGTLTVDASLEGGTRARVVTAVSGGEALDRLAEESFGAILTDVRMPDLDGRGLDEEIVRRWPGRAKRVVFVTGDTLATSLRDFVKSTGRPVIEKPFLPGEVRRVVAELSAAGGSTSVDLSGLRVGRSRCNQRNTNRHQPGRVRRQDRRRLRRSHRGQRYRGAHAARVAGLEGAVVGAPRGARVAGRSGRASRDRRAGVPDRGAQEPGARPAHRRGARAQTAELAQCVGRCRPPGAGHRCGRRRRARRRIRGRVRGRAREPARGTRRLTTRGRETADRARVLLRYIVPQLSWRIRRSWIASSSLAALRSGAPPDASNARCRSAIAFALRQRSRRCAVSRSVTARSTSSAVAASFVPPCPAAQGFAWKLTVPSAATQRTNSADAGMIARQAAAVRAARTMRRRMANGS